MIILSKLADYGVIVATHLAAFPDRQVNAATVAAEAHAKQWSVGNQMPLGVHAAVMERLFQAGVPFDFLGAGSNLLVADEGPSFVVIAYEPVTYPFG